MSNLKHHSYKVKPSKGAGKENATEKWPTSKTGGQKMGRRRGEKILREDEMNTSCTHMA